MENEDIFLALIGIFVFACIITTAILIFTSSSYESIHVNVLDNVCKELYNNSNATYYSEISLQDHFTCNMSNTIYIIPYK